MEAEILSFSSLGGFFVAGIVGWVVVRGMNGNGKKRDVCHLHSNMETKIDSLAGQIHDVRDELSGQLHTVDTKIEKTITLLEERTERRS